MDKKLVSAFNDQINRELYSAYLYLAMAAYCETVNMGGFAHWLRVQYKEETSHAMKMFGFLVDRGQRVSLDKIDRPQSDFSNVQEIFAETLKHEKKVTLWIGQLYDQAVKLNDTAAAIFLQWFVTEQVEEEKNATQILDTIKLIKPESAQIIMLDRELARREG